MIKCDVVANRDGECCITLETVSWREARLSSQSGSGIAPSPKTRALWNGQSRAVTGESLDNVRMLTDATSCYCALRQGIEREFLAQRVRRYLVGHVHSHVHRYMTYSRPWTVDHGTARRALFCRLLFKQNAMQACSCLAVGSAFLPSKTQMMQLRSTLTRLGIPSSLRAEDRVVLSCLAVPQTEIS